MWVGQKSVSYSIPWQSSADVDPVLSVLPPPKHGVHSAWPGAL